LGQGRRTLTADSPVTDHIDKRHEPPQYLWGYRSSHGINYKEHHMCSPARCARCGKTTWTGCGNHVDTVMASVHPTQRCACDRTPEQPAWRFPWPRRHGM